MRTPSLALAALAGAALLVAPAISAHHFTLYARYSLQHDDLGRSDEPDGRVTSVLGPLVQNCVVQGGSGCLPDTSLPAPAPGRSALLAPGCTDDSGRQPSGLCGLWTIGGFVGLPPPGAGGIQGMSGTGAPGRMTPTKATTVTFLDARMVAMSSTYGVYYDFNHKLEDRGVYTAMAAWYPHANPFVHGNTGVWAWQGTWQDKNGNGVIDHHGSFTATTDGQPVPPQNEFVWHGGCRDSGGAHNPKSEQSRYCSRPWGAAPNVVGWAFPGGHNAFPVPDKAGLAYACLFAGPYGSIPQCHQWGPYGAPDTMQGDWLVEYQYDLRPEWRFTDLTGEPDLAHRGWHQTVEHPVRFYDQSLVNTIVTIVALDPPSGTGAGAPGGLRPQDGRLVDVDEHRTWVPAMENFLRASVKPAFRGSWQMACAMLHPPASANCSP